MARKDDGDSAISLFSFQDIITSITGIMFLVVLLLMLMMLSSHVPTHKSRQVTESSKALQQELARLKEKIKALQNSKNILDDEINKIKKLSPEEIAHMKKLLQQQISQQQEQLDLVNNSIVQKNVEQKKLDPMLKKLKAETAAQLETIKNIKQQIAKIDPEIKKLEKNKAMRTKIMKFAINTSTPRKPVIAELGKDGVRLINVTQQNTIDLRVKNDPQESFDKLENHLKTMNNSEYYFSVALQPGGFPHAYKVLKIFSDKNFERGLEILPDDKTTLANEVTP